MKVICVDDESGAAENTAAVCLQHPEVDEARCYTSARDALSGMDEHPADLAFLDIHMPDMNGLELASAIMEKYPQTAVVFLTRYSRYAVEAFAIHASGYLLKPAGKERVFAEIDHALLHRQKKPFTHVRVQTFGGFDLFVDDELVTFKYAKSKELFAYLVDKYGSSVTRAEAFAVLWEDRLYDRPMQKQLDVIIRSMHATLKSYGIEEVFELKKGAMRIRPEMLSCDLYRLLEGDREATDAYRGEYMNVYSWASITESFCDYKLGYGPLTTDTRRSERGTDR